MLFNQIPHGTLLALEPLGSGEHLQLVNTGIEVYDIPATTFLQLNIRSAPRKFANPKMYRGRI